MEVVLETVVRCTEIDVNGHVNNAKFVEYLEWGREEWYDRHGFPYDRLRGLGAITVVVNINLNLRQACRQGDQLRIITRPERRGRTSFAFAQRIEQMDGAVAADATVTLVTIDPNTRRGRPLPEEFGRLFRPPPEFTRCPTKAPAQSASSITSKQRPDGELTQFFPGDPPCGITS